MRSLMAMTKDLIRMQQSSGYISGFDIIAGFKPVPSDRKLIYPAHRQMVEDWLAMDDTEPYVDPIELRIANAHADGAGGTNDK